MCSLALVVLLETLTCHSDPSLFLVTEYQIAEQVWATAHTHTLSMLKVYAIICASPKCVLLNVHAQSVCHHMCKLKVCFIKCACSKCVRHYLVHNDVLHIHPQLWFCNLKIHTCHLLVKRCQCTTSFFRTSAQNQRDGGHSLSDMLFEMLELALVVVCMLWGSINTVVHISLSS